MRYLKKVLCVSGLAAVGLLAVFLYSNNALTDKSRDMEDPGSRIMLLTRVGHIYTLNDRTGYELGKAYFDQGIQSLGRGQDGARHFQAAIRSFRRSLELNPFSPFSHFHLAQSLFYAGATSSAEGGGAFEEYKRSAELSGRNSQIYFEVGKIFLSRWKDLSGNEKNFAVGILMVLLANRNPDRMRALMTIWDMDVQDYDVIERILPVDPYALRVYATFLGEKTRSLERRQKALSKAETLEFRQAKTEADLSENNLFYFRTKESLEHSQKCLEILDGIRFYQVLSGQDLIDPDEFAELRRSALLGAARARIEQGAAFKDVEPGLDAYLELENRVAAVSDLAAYLKGNVPVFNKMEQIPEDLGNTHFQLALYFKQNRYQEIIKIGRSFQGSFVPPGRRDEYVRILCLVGDANQKSGFLYDAGDYYQKALEIYPENLEALIKLRKNYERLSNEQKVKEVQDRILKLLTPRELSLGSVTLPKGESYTRTLICDGGATTLEIAFGEETREELRPLVTVILNGRVIWEDYLNRPVLSLPAKTGVGRNVLEISPVNRNVTLMRISLR
jgi:tetratricopeptide (TPR) repeat protein